MNLSPVWFSAYLHIYTIGFLISLYLVKKSFFLYIPSFSVLLTRFRTGSAVPHLAAFWVPRTVPPFFIAASIKNTRLTPFDTRRSKPTKTEKSSRFRLLSAPMWHRTRAWLFLYIYFIFISLSSDNTTVFPFYPALSRSFPYTPLLWHGMCSSTKKLVSPLYLTFIQPPLFFMLNLSNVYIMRPFCVATTLLA